jgi:hypothetical protein
MTLAATRNTGPQARQLSFFQVQVHRFSPLGTQASHAILLQRIWAAQPSVKDGEAGVTSCDAEMGYDLDSGSVNTRDWL